MSNNILEDDNVVDLNIQALAKFLDDEKLSEIVYYNQPVNWLSGAFICTATSPRHIDSVADKLRKFRIDGSKMIIDGDARSEWVIASTGGYVVHLFTQEKREYYTLDELWQHALKK